MNLAHARALLPPEALEVQPYQPQRDARALHRLARWLMRFSPVVQADVPDGVLLDIAGCEHLFGGETGMLREMRGTLHRLGFSARLAAAPSIGAAHALARFAETPVTTVQAAAVRQALAPPTARCFTFGADDSGGACRTWFDACRRCRLAAAFNVARALR